MLNSAAVQNASFVFFGLHTNRLIRHKQLSVGGHGPGFIVAHFPNNT